MKLKDYIGALLVILISLGLCITAIIYASIYRQENESSLDAVEFSPPVAFLLETPAETEEASVNATSDAAATAASETTTAPQTPAETEFVMPDDSRIYYTSYHFCSVDTDYFNDAVFIGNSRLQGFILYSKLPDLKAYTSVGMTVKSYFTKADFTVNGVAMTAAEALYNTPGFTKVYIKLGINELGWVSTDQFVSSYALILDHIYSVNPNTIIFINSVLPVAEAAIEKDPTLSMEKITEYNSALKELAAQYGACYLDVASIFTGEDGYMPYDYSFDGVHLNPASVQMWLSYLLEHGIKED